MHLKISKTSNSRWIPGEIIPYTPEDALIASGILRKSNIIESILEYITACGTIAFIFKKNIKQSKSSLRVQWTFI